MRKRISEDRAILSQIKQIRRFAMTLTSDEAMANSAVLGSILEKRDLLSSASDFGRVHHSLLRDVYRHLYLQSDRRRKLSLMTPETGNDISVKVKFQSLDIDARAIVSLYLIERLSCSEITSILDQPLSQIMDVLEKSLAFLSGCEVRDVSLHRDTGDCKISL